MARGGFLGRIGRAFGRVERAIERIIAPPRPAPPPAPPQPPGRGGPPIRRDPYREIWRDHKRGRKGSFERNYRVFSKLVDPVVEDDDEKRELWESFIRNIVNGEGDRRRNSTSNMFWRDSGIDPRDFDWALWRQAMGYTGRNRSRTP
jgi:hypothetical protein